MMWLSPKCPKTAVAQVASPIGVLDMRHCEQSSLLTPPTAHPPPTLVRDTRDTEPALWQGQSCHPWCSRALGEQFCSSPGPLLSPFSWFLFVFQALCCCTGTGEFVTGCRGCAGGRYPQRGQFITKEMVSQECSG